VAGSSLTNIAALVYIASLVGERALAVQGAALAGNELTGLFLGHVLVAVVATVAAIVTAVGVGRSVVDIGMGMRAGTGGGAVAVGRHRHFRENGYVEERLAHVRRRL
jgi:hypothetical protein